MTIFRPLGLAAGLALVAAPAFALPNDDASDTFDMGVEMLRRGRTEEALAAFQKVLAMDLSNEEAYELWKRTDAEIWLDMMSEQGEMELVAKRLMSLAKARTVEHRDDAQAIRGLIQQINGDDALARLLATRTLAADHGEYAVQYMLPSLNSQASAEQRAVMMQALTSMGDDVVLPLTAALEVEEAMQRRNVAITLGRIGDHRAAPFLARLAKMDADGGVQEAAAEALAMCGGAERGAEFAFNVLGEQYHMTTLNVLRPDQVSDVIWRLEGGKLMGTPVPPYFYGQEMAKVAFYNALRVNPGSPRAMAGLVRTFATEMQIVADRRAGGLEVGDEAMAARAGLLAVAAAGKGAVDAALSASIKDKDMMAAIGICHAIQQGLAVAGNGLNEALKSGDSVLRAEAALAMASMFKGGDVMPQMVGALGEAAGRQISRVAAIVDADPQRAAATAAALEAKGMMVNVWADGIAALGNMHRIPGLDVVIVADRLPNVTTDQVLTELEMSSRLGATPRLVISSDMDTAEELYGDRVAGVISGQDLSPVSDALSESMGRDRELADQLSRRSSAALARLADQGANVGAALSGLVAAVSNGRPDDVTIPALEALGASGTANEATICATLAADDTASDAVREAAAFACAEMFGRGVPGDGAAGALRGVVASDAALNVRGAAAAALGRLNLDPAMRSELLELVRVNAGE